MTIVVPWRVLAAVKGPSSARFALVRLMTVPGRYAPKVLKKPLKAASETV